MKFTLSWLKDHLETDADPGRIATTLTALGLEVESVSDRAKALAPFTAAEILKAERHPNADKLQVCTVRTGHGTVQVVCGAPNARTGLKVVFAPVGSHIPGSDLTLKKGVIRGVSSDGMLVSERELGLSEEHTGIIELPADAPVGTPFARLRGLDDPLFEIGLTPDRADCAGVRGIARDLAAAGLGHLKPQVGGHLDSTPVTGRNPSRIGVRIDAPAGACPLFVGRYIKGVRNGESPRWLQDKLSAVGLRPISALVDVTNYLTLDVARPLHVFDADTLAGGIIVRPARAEETLKALNGKDYKLDEAMTVIADPDGVLGLAGVIGGEGSGCTEDTVNVFIECALFDPVRTAATGRKLGIDSDARYRFERGVDPGAVFEGMERVTRLILDICGGTPSELVVAGAEPEWRRSVTLRPTRVAQLGGIDIPEAEQERILTALGFVPTLGGEGLLTVAVPSWRGDVEGEADLVEEIMRVHGYDAILPQPLPRTAAVTRPALSPGQRRVGDARRALAARGLEEAVTWSFLSGSVAGLFGETPPELRLLNPISADLDVMRPSLLPNLIQAAGRNADRGWPDVALFEVGPAYRDATSGGQDTVAAGIRAGSQVPRQWAEASRPVDCFDAKADALACLEAAGAPVASLQVTADAPPWYHPGRSGVLRLGAAVLGRFGEIHPGVLERLGVKGPVVGFETFLSAVPAPKPKAGAGTARPLLKLSPFQPIRRDFAFVVEGAVSAERVVRAVRGADKALVREVAVFDVYQGPGIEPGKKSLAVAVTLQPVERTPTDGEIEAVAAKIVAAVVKGTGASLRG